MKRYSAAAAGILLLLLAGCDLGLQMPEKLTVKTSPTINIPLGSRSDALVDFDEFNQMVSDVEDPETGITRSDSVDGTLAFSLRKDVLDIPIDDFADTTLALDQMNQTIGPVTFAVPDISFPGETISENIAPIALPADVAIPPQSITGIPEGAGVTVTDTVTTGTISAGGFTSITFGTGTLNATITASNASAGMTVTIDAAEIQDTSGSTIVTAAISDATAVDGAALQFTLDGVTLPSDFQVAFTATVSNGGLDTFDLDTNFAFDTATTNITAGSGVAINQTFTGSTVVPLTTDSNFVSAIIGSNGPGDGTIVVDQSFPATGWSGITSTITLELYQGTSVTPLRTASGTPPLTLDLNGLAVGSGDITVQYEVAIQNDIDAGTGDSIAVFALDSGANEVNGSVSGSITTFQEVVITSTENLDFSQTISQAIDTQIQDMVQSVAFTAPKVTIDLKNELPTNIGVTLSSVVLAPDPLNDSNTFESRGPLDSSEAWVVDLLTSTGGVLTVNDGVNPPLASVDATLAVSLSGYDSATQQLTLNGVTSGSSYSLNGTVTAEFPVDTMTIHSATSSGIFPAAADPALDFSMLSGVLPDAISIADIEAVIELAMTDVSGSFELYLEAQYTDQSGVQTQLPLVGESSALPAAITIDTPVDINDLATVINARPNDLRLSYEVTAAGVTVNAVTDPNTPRSIQASLDAIIPFAINVAGTDLYGNPPATAAAEIQIDGSPVMPAPTDDIFGRTTPEDTEQINEYLDFAQAVGIQFNLTNTTGLNAVVVIEDLADTGFYREIDFSDGKKVLDLTREEIEIIRADVPFTPNIRVYIPNTSINDPMSLNANGLLNIDSVVLSIETDVDYSASLSGQDEL